MAWVFFRAESVENAADYIQRALVINQEYSGFRMSFTPAVLILVLLLLETRVFRQKKKVISIVVETTGLLFVIGHLLASFSAKTESFIYFQF